MSAERPSAVLAAESLARSGAVGAAVAACYEALAVSGRSAHVHALLAHLMLEGDFYDEAIAEATTAIEADPDCAPAYLALGLAYDRRGGMWDQSVLVWHELAEVVPDLVTAHVQLGEAFAAAAFEDEALESWKRALELDPKEPRATYNLAIASLKREGMALALPLFRQAGELDPSQDELFFSLLGVGEPSPEPIDPARVKPTREARLGAAGLALRGEDLFTAAELVRLALDELPDDPEALALAAYAYLKQEAANEAMACALRALSLDATLATALYSLGVVYARRTGLNRHAARVFLALAKRAPDRALVHVLLAESLLGLQRYEQAGRAYRLAVRLDPACVRARFGLAASYLTAGRHAEAQWEIRRAAHYDTKRQGLFFSLYDRWVAGGEAS
ncbi:MAG: tetratricopeptide repeat protein [Coriobacteriia bacterium]|nr:tetratricopeptide repeat protein [Coriobacteriia bacterium]MBN2848201.1 tetratricopeptide repeat protein [Coriobacteriia bacterium]